MHRGTPGVHATGATELTEECPRNGFVAEACSTPTSAGHGPNPGSGIAQSIAGKRLQETRAKRRTGTCRDILREAGEDALRAEEGRGPPGD